MSAAASRATTGVIAVRRARRDAAARELAARSRDVAQAREELDRAEQREVRACEELAAFVGGSAIVDARAQLERAGLEDVVRAAAQAVTDARRRLEVCQQRRDQAQAHLLDADRELRTIEKLEDRLVERTLLEARQKARRG